MLLGLSLAHLLLLAPCLVQADSSAYWVQPSSKWLAIDGTWSSFEVNLGNPSQPVQLLVSTAISEVWAISKGGCQSNNNLCTTQRGNVYNAASSQNDAPLGAWSLGLASSSLGGSGDYGLDRLSMANGLSGATVSINNALIASVNTTDYYQGYIGLGVIHGRFGSTVTVPLIAQMAQEYGLIPSHSYGYTAGAYHVNGGVPASLVLGGFDPLRFQSHNTVFNLHPDTRIPQVRLRGISVNLQQNTTAPSNWAGQSQKPLVAMEDSLIATIDSSLPYMVLPESICDRFADALGLTYNSTFDLYLPADNRQVSSVNPPLRMDQLNFTFSLSSWDNNDNFGKPLEIPGVVNITISGESFMHSLTYPFKNSFRIDAAGVPYFPLRRAKNVNEIVIGRAFLQEAYIITKYEERTFSLYQAQFPRNAASNYSVEIISRPANSDYPAYISTQTGPGLTAGQTAGVAVGVVGATAILFLGLWLWRRRSNKAAALAKAQSSPQEKEGSLCQDSGSTLGPDKTTTPFARLVSFLTRGRRPRRAEPVSLSHELDGSGTQPVEVAADAAHERYEMSAPIEPVELDATNYFLDSDDTTELGTEASEEIMSEYETTRRKLDRQLQGPLPKYTPPNIPTVHVGHPSIDTAHETKSLEDVSPVAHYRPGQAEYPSPTISVPSDGNHTNSFSTQVPSPLSPNPDWGARFLDLPSPVTMGPPGQLPLRRTGSASNPRERQQYGDISRPASTHNGSYPVSPASPRSFDMTIPSPSIQRTPIDQGEIVCLGPLPDNVLLPNQQPLIARNHPTILPADSASQAAGAYSRGAVPVSPHSSLALPSPRSPATPVTVSSMGSPSSSADPRRCLRIEPPTASPGQTKRVPKRGSADTLGSNFTVDEVEVKGNTSRRQNSHDTSMDGMSPQSMHSPERIDAATELVHIPQVSERRYSWEDDKML